MDENKKGFTLIELLATITVTVLLFISVAVVAIQLINNGKNKTYKVTANEIEKNASLYLTESDSQFFFKDNNNSNVEYQCITVKNLVEYGYLDKNVYDSKISDDIFVQENDYIYIERNTKTKTITKTLYVNLHPRYLEICRGNNFSEYYYQVPTTLTVTVKSQTDKIVSEYTNTSDIYVSYVN